MDHLPADYLLGQGGEPLRLKTLEKPEAVAIVQGWLLGRPKLSPLLVSALRQLIPELKEYDLTDQ